MIKYFLAFVFITILSLDHVIAQEKVTYPTISYLNIKLDSFGHLPSNPYILEFENKKKKIVFCGTNHLSNDSDIDNPMFKKIEEKFFSFKPDICVNEGGDVSNKKYASRQEAIRKSGEIGLTKILSDSLKIKTINGDPPNQLEFKGLLKKYSKGEFLVYIATERLMWSLVGRYITDSAGIEKNYVSFIQDYIMRQGKVYLNKNERSFSFFKDNYKKLLGRAFNINELEPTNPFISEGKFQEIGRASKEIRDQFLLKTIDNLLDTNDKVFVVFGGWHLLTCKPGLEQIIKKDRD